MQPHDTIEQLKGRPWFTKAAIGQRVGYAWRPEWSTASYATREMGKAVAEIRMTVDAAYADRDKYAKEENWSALGKARKVRDEAVKRLDSLRNSQTTKSALNSYKTRREALLKTLTAELKKPEHPHDVQVASDVRRHLMSLNRMDRASFLRTNAADPFVASAVMNAPPFLSGLTKEEQAAFSRESRKAIHPEEFAEFATMEKAREVAAQAFERAEELIVEVAGIRRSNDGSKWLAEGEEDTTKRTTYLEEQQKQVEEKVHEWDNLILPPEGEALLEEDGEGDGVKLNPESKEPVLEPDAGHEPAAVHMEPAAAA